jgi:RES domain-containing protein
VLAYRVFPYHPSATAGEAGSPSYLHKPQGQGRLDNPGEYDVWYLSVEASGAVGETFGNLATWSPAMFPFPGLPGARKALGVYELDDDLPLLELDDARNLLDRGLRPTQVVERNRSATQAWALAIFRERDHRGNPRWAGVRWWSYHRPQWRILGVWGAVPRCVLVEDLDMGHIAVVDAARTLTKLIVP